MEEKERYELRIYAGCESYSITDTKGKQQLTIENVINLLNQQDKRIKELEKQLNKDFTLGEYIRLEKENQQLKQTIQTMHQNVRNGSLEDIKHIEALKEEINDLKDTNISIFEYSKKVEQENNELKQQLHELPKKIVEEIKGKLHDRLSKIAGYGRMTTDEFSFFVENEFTKDIDTILKKYGGENE